MAIFNPFEATLEEAQALPEAFHPGGPIWQWIGAQKLLQNRKAYEADVLSGVQVCAVHDLVMPIWLATAYSSAFTKTVNGHFGSWDEAFGAAHPKGTQLGALRRRRRNMVKVALAFSEKLQRDPTRAVDKTLWQEIGEAVGEGTTRAEELYRQALQMGLAQSASKIRDRLGAPNRPIKNRKVAGIRKQR